MSTASSVLLAVARELALQAKKEMPDLKDGEIVKGEWFSNGIYFRATELNGQQFIYQFDFRQKKSRLAMADK